MSDLKEKLAVHLEALHLDAQEQPSLACEAAEAAAEAKASSKRAALVRDQTEASVQAKVRANPESFGVAKVTEAAIAAAVATNIEVMKAGQAAVDAELAWGRAEAVANAYDHRRAMIKEAVQLWLGNYWGDVTVRERDMRGTVESAKERKVDEGLRRRRLDA